MLKHVARRRPSHHASTIIKSQEPLVSALSTAGLVATCISETLVSCSTTKKGFGQATTAAHARANPERHRRTRSPCARYGCVSPASRGERSHRRVVLGCSRGGASRRRLARQRMGATREQQQHGRQRGHGAELLPCGRRSVRQQAVSISAIAVSERVPIFRPTNLDTIIVPIPPIPSP